MKPKNILSIVKTVKSRTSLDQSCYNNMLSGDGPLSIVKAVEQMLQTESSEQINDTVTNEDLRTAHCRRDVPVPDHVS